MFTYDTPPKVVLSDEEIRETLKKVVIKPLTCFKQGQLLSEMFAPRIRSDPKSNIVGDMLLKAKLNNPDLSIAHMSIDTEYLPKSIEDIKNEY